MRGSSRRVIGALIAAAMAGAPGASMAPAHQQAAIVQQVGKAIPETRNFLRQIRADTVFRTRHGYRRGSNMGIFVARAKARKAGKARWDFRR
jgi:hypothetical protein